MFDNDVSYRLLASELLREAEEKLSSKQFEEFEELITDGGRMRDAIRFIAEKSGEPEPRIRQRLKRVRKKLQQIAEDLEVASDRNGGEWK